MNDNRTRTARIIRAMRENIRVIDTPGTDPEVRAYLLTSIVNHCTNPRALRTDEEHRALRKLERNARRRLRPLYRHYREDDDGRLTDETGRPANWYLATALP